MKWNTYGAEDASSFGTRGVRWRRQGQRWLFCLGVCGLLAFFTLHPTGQQIVRIGQTVGQGVGRFSEEQFVHFFGPALILRQRAAWTSGQLKTDIEQLQAIEQSATQKIAALQSELPPLVEAQAAAVQTMQALTGQLQPPAGAVVRVQAFMESDQAPRPEALAAQVLAYSDLQEQLGRDQAALRGLRATLSQAQALQAEAQPQVIALDSTLALFNALWANRAAAPAEQGLLTSELLAFRNALQVEIEQAEAIHQARRSLEAGLAGLNLPAAQPTPNLRSATSQ